MLIYDENHKLENVGNVYSDPYFILLIHLRNHIRNFKVTFT